LGKEHSDTAAAYENIATLYGNQKKFDEAFALYIKAYRVYVKAFDEDHPNAKKCLNNLRIDYKAAKREQPFDDWLAGQMGRQAAAV